MDAIELLMTQHAEVETIFEKLDTEFDECSCHELVGRLVDRLTMHAALEEELFYPAVAKLPEGAAVASQARADHDEIERLLEGLRDPHAPKRVFDPSLRELRRTVEHHVAAEEREIFPLARGLGAGGLRDLGRQLEARINGSEVAELRTATGA